MNGRNKYAAEMRWDKRMERYEQHQLDKQMKAIAKAKADCAAESEKKGEGYV